MKKTIFPIVITTMVLTLFTSLATAKECASDKVVETWIKDRNKTETVLMKKWLALEPATEIARDVAVIVAKEVYITTYCRSNLAFIKKNVHVLNSKTDPDPELVPAALLEKAMGYPFLDPSRGLSGTR